MDKEIDTPPESETGKQKHLTEFVNLGVASKNVESSDNSIGHISFDGTFKNSSVIKHDSAASRHSKKSILFDIEGNPSMQLISAADLMAKKTRTGSGVRVIEDRTSM